jgi:hypothetical protein
LITKIDTRFQSELTRWCTRLSLYVFLCKRDTSKDTGRDAGRDTGRDRGRDTSRDIGRDAGRDTGRVRREVGGRGEGGLGRKVGLGE